MQRVTQRGGGRGTRAGGWAWAVGVLLASSVACSLSDDLCVLQRLPPAEPGAGGLRPPHAPRTRPRLLRPLLRPQLQRLRGGLDSAAEAPPPGEAPPPAAPCAGGEDDASGQALPAGGDDEEEEDDFSLGAVSGGHASEETGGAGQGSAPAADDAAAEPGEQRAGRGAGDGEDTAGVDDVDVVECNFERIGDTNGVFYYLGQQQCAEPTDDAVAQALKLAAPAAPDGAGAQRRFRNPALTGRVQVKTGPQRVMCASKFKGRLASPEQVLDRSVVGDQFWFPDGWVAFDLGLYTSLQPSAYMMRNGGGLPRDKVMTGWVLEGATWVKGEYWREGDWQALDTHTNDTSFLDLALQAEADGTAAGYTHQTSPPMRVDHRTGKVQPAIHHELSFTWTPTPLGEMPHHTLAFHVDCQRSFRYLRMRQLTHVGHTHMDEPWYGHEDFYIQGLELYGKLSIQVLQSSVGPTKPCDKGMWMFGMDRQDPTKETKMWWARGAVDQCDADREVAYYKEKYIERLKELYVDDPPPRTPEEMQPPSYDRDFEDSTPSDSEVYPPVFVN